MEGTETKTVRFSKLVEEFGKPALYLPLADPSKDSKFQHAAKENRVLTIKQDPTSKQKDFGMVGFLPEKFVTYLIFPRSLERFANARVVGIKYDELADATLAPPPGAIPSRPKTSPKNSAPTVEREPKREPKPRIEPKPRPEPQPKTFSIRVRVTATASSEEEISVTAMTKAEARNKAEEQASALELPKPDLKIKVLKVREKS